MSQPFAPLLTLLAFSNSAAAIYPEEILAETIDNVVGPARTRSARTARSVPAARPFRRYVSRDEPRAATGGKREQFPDEIRFVPVPDPNTRVEGLLSGQFAYADEPARGELRSSRGERRGRPLLLKPFGWPVFAINHKQGLLTNKDIRLALQAALPIDDMFFAAFGDDKFFLVDGPLYPEGWSWRTEAGTELYNQNDQKAAAEMLEEAGYDGTPLRILTSRQYEFHFKMAEVAKQALEMAGFTVQMDVVDWATLGQRRDDPTLWDIYITHSPFLPEPALTDFYSPTLAPGLVRAREGRDLREVHHRDRSRQAAGALRRAAEQDLRGRGLHQDRRLQRAAGVKQGLTGVPASPWPFFWNAKVE